MINEVAEAKCYLNGENIDQNNLYRVCYIILKYLKSEGYSKLDARERLFAWGNEFHIYIKYDVNFMIGYIWDYDKRDISSLEYVSVSEDDIYQINRRFDHKKVKLVAFAMLCYAKAHANKKGEFTISYGELASWTGLNYSTIYKIYMKEIVAFQFADIVPDTKKPIFKHGGNNNKRTRFKILVDHDNSGEHQVNNDVRTAFESIFGLIE